MIQYKKLIPYIFTFLVLTYYSFNNTQVTLNGVFQQVILALLIVLFVLYLFVRPFQFNELGYYFLFIFLGVLSYLNNHSTLFLILALSVAVLSTFPTEKLLSLFLIFRSIFIAIIVFLSLIGVLSNNGRDMFKSNVENAVTTYSLGFGHPNQAAQAIGIVLIVLFFVWFKNKTVLIEKTIFGIGAISLFYWLTKSRTFLICCTLALLIGVMQHLPFFEKGVRWIKKGYFLLEIIIILLGLVLPAIFTRFSGSSFIGILDRIASGRISFSASVFQSYPITLFGSNFDEGFTELQHIYGMGKYAVDNGYISFLFTYGLVFTIIYFIMLTILLRTLIRKEEYYFAWIVVVISLWGLFENIVWIPTLNITLLLWAQSLKAKLNYDKTKRVVKNEKKAS